MGLLDTLVTATTRLRALVADRTRRRRADRYERSARRIGDTGYAEYKEAQLLAAVQDRRLCEQLAWQGALAAGYGRGLDERIVEYPWVLGRLPDDATDVLDAGSTLNHDWLCGVPTIRSRRIVVVTLAPEGRVAAPNYSFLYGDLRRLPLKDACMDAIVCLSTLEHVGMDNSRYTGRTEHVEPDSYREAFAELVRVLRPGGHLLMTVPFGRPAPITWLQVFNGEMVDDLRARFPGTCEAEAYFRSTPDGWVSGTRDACRDAVFLDAPSPVAGGHPAISAGAVCALHLRRAP